jgi:hypothetical protein
MNYQNEHRQLQGIEHLESGELYLRTPVIDPPVWTPPEPAPSPPTYAPPSPQPEILPDNVEPHGPEHDPEDDPFRPRPSRR